MESEEIFWTFIGIIIGLMLGLIIANFYAATGNSAIIGEHVLDNFCEEINGEGCHYADNVIYGRDYSPSCVCTPDIPELNITFADLPIDVSCKLKENGTIICFVPRVSHYVDDCEENSC